ncbi:MAG: ImmA/IrrE family metallo-endopeptidase [Oscillospiraceae bacterium]|jgi:Zn-dependent peptidase ImmA (M78 family)|nr:ImmA/IrrE family metallo-endopeptidase [Oscillospiraceae bacterium]
MNMKKVAAAVLSRYQTRNPFKICDMMGINVAFTDLNGTRGFFHRALNVDTIYIDDSLNGYVQEFVCAHELGHALLHADYNAVYLDTRTYQVMGKLENAADRFAAFLLWPDDDELLEYADYSYERLSFAMGLPENLVRWRFEQISPERMES